MEKAPELEKVLNNFAYNLNYLQRESLSNCIKELKALDITQIPSFGEELISSAFSYQQRVIDRQKKLSAYIRKQQIIIGANFFINSNKVIEAYAYITFEIKKILVMFKKYDKDFSEIKSEIMIRLIALKDYMKMIKGGTAQSELENNKDLLMKLEILEKQYEMFYDLLATQELEFNNIGQTVATYILLYDDYTSYAEKYCEGNDPFSRLIKTLVRVRKNKETTLSNLQVIKNWKNADVASVFIYFNLFSQINAIFLFKKFQILASTFIENGYRTGDIERIIFDKEKLSALASFFLAYFRDYRFHEPIPQHITSDCHMNMNKIEDLLAEAFLDEDTTEHETFYIKLTDKTTYLNQIKDICKTGQFEGQWFGYTYDRNLRIKGIYNLAGLMQAIHAHYMRLKEEKIIDHQKVL